MHGEARSHGAFVRIETHLGSKLWKLLADGLNQFLVCFRNRRLNATAFDLARQLKPLDEGSVVQAGGVELSHCMPNPHVSGMIGIKFAVKWIQIKLFNEGLGLD